MLLRSKNKVQRFVTPNNDLTDACLGNNQCYYFRTTYDHCIINVGAQ